ncbi:MAG: sulfatase [Acidobacteria bacterium]|nr:sulfatase [Acidobacteriota bacterium]
MSRRPRLLPQPLCSALAVVVLPTVALLTSACGPAAPPASGPIRLVDLFHSEDLEGTEGRAAPPMPPLEWDFTLAETAIGEFVWEAGPGVSNLALAEKRLAGRATTDFPILHVQSQGPLSADLVHAVEIRMRVSTGTNLWFTSRGEEEIDLNALAEEWPHELAPITTPIIAGEEMRTYVLRPRLPLPATSLRHILIRPTDVADSRFEIESIRIIRRHEHLARIRSGVSWQGLAEIYRETLVTRSPEVARFTFAVPDGGWLDLAVGTIEKNPVIFQVDLLSPGGDEPGQRLMTRTLTRPDRWEEIRVELAGLAGRQVTLTLSLAAEKRGALGFWGSPVVRVPAPPAVSRSTRQAGVAYATGTLAPPQGVILIWADTLRQDHLGVYGYDRNTSPHLDRMATDGVRFTHCTTQATWTKVSTPSLMTSLYPLTHGVREFSGRLPASAVTLAEIFRENGYATISLTSNLFTGKFTNLHQGFETVYEPGSLSSPESSKTTRERMDQFLPWLEAHQDTPFFTFLHIYDPHDPYRPEPPYDTLWADPAWRKEHEEQMQAVRSSIQDPLLKMFGMPNRAELTQAGLDPDLYVSRERDWYDGSIRAMDAEIGRLLERLRELGLAERTLVIFTADHGEEFMEHGRMFHGQSVYGELTRAPLMAWWPGTLPAGQVVDAIVQTVDIMPTVLELAGLNEPETIQGRSLVRMIMGQENVPAALAAQVPAFSEKAATVETAGPPPRDTESYSIVLDDWKLIRNLHRPPSQPEFELFHHRQDPLDLSDVAGEHPEVVRELAARLDALRVEATAARLKPDSKAVDGLSADDLERLRSLGYIQ